MTVTHKLVVVFAITMMASCPAFSQSGNFSGGYDPTHSYSTFQYDSVDKTSGNLLLDIPLASFRQRDGHDFTYSLRYSGKQLTLQTYEAEYGCEVDDNGNLDGCYWVPFYYWGAGSPDSFSVMPRMDDQLTLGGIGYAAYYYYDGEGTVPFMDSLHLIQTSDGASHPVMTATNGEYITADSSGFMSPDASPGSQLNDLVYDENGLGHTVETFTGAPISNYSDYDPPIIYEKDHSGNQIVVNANGTLTDTAGRTLPIFYPGFTADPTGQISGPIPPGMTTTSDGCTGPLPIKYASAVVLPGPAGSTVQYKFCWAMGQLQTNFLAGGWYQNFYPTEASDQMMILQSVVLPNNTAYTFEYNDRDPGDSSSVNYLDLTKITLPTGGTISYTWQTNGVYGANATTGIARVLASRTENAGGNPQTWTYSYSFPGGSWQTTETSPPANIDGGSTVTTELSGMRENWAGEWLGSTPYSISVSDNASGNVLRSWTANSFASFGGQFNDAGGNFVYDSTWFLPTSETTVLDGVSSATQTTQYNATLNIQVNTMGYPLAGPFPITFNKPTSVSYGNYDGTILRQDSTAFAWQSSNPDFLSSNILLAPASQTTLDAQGNTVSQVTYTYDSGNCGSANVGNLCSITRFNNAGTAAVTNYTYNPTGQPVTVQDPNGNVITTTYGPDGVFPSVLTRPTTSGFLHRSWTTYDVGTGKLTASTDENGSGSGDPAHTTSYTYDSMGRPTSIIGPPVPVNGSQARPTTTICYTDLTNTCPEGSTPNTTYASQLATPDPAIVEFATFDGLGRLVHRGTTSSPSIQVDTVYDAVGRISATTNPYYPPASAGATSFAYDALDRPALRCDADNGTATGLCSPGPNTVSWQFAGAKTTEVDERGVSISRSHDALNRLVSVQEPGSLMTGYAYDALGNLRTVQQLGNPQLGDVPRNRTFTYDSLSRLLCSSNPESNPNITCPAQPGTYPSGATTYSYDQNGNVTHKTDAKGVVASYTYDALNRLTTTSYSDGVTPESVFVYDVESILFNPTHRYTTSNVIGRLSIICVEVPGACQSMTAYSYDATGRPIQALTSTPSGMTTGDVYVTSAGYDLAGNKTDLWYPSGRHVQDAWDGAGRQTNSTLADVNGVAPSSAINYVSAATYNPDGSTAALSLNNVVQETIGENNRLQTTSLAAVSLLNGTTFLSRSYCYSGCATGGTANNGNIWWITDNLNGSRSQGFIYDGLNRISSFWRGGALNQQYSIDSFGNLSGVTNGVVTTTFNASNRMSNLPCASVVQGYDAAGNQTCFTDQNGAVSQVIYDAANRVSSMNVLNSQTPYVNYLYDADGNRIQKSNPTGGTYTEYLSLNGETVAEREQAGNWTDYIYAAGRRIARVDPTTNLVPYSQQFGGPGWGGYCGPTSNMTVNTTDLTAPDGTGTATKFVVPAGMNCGQGVSWGVLTFIPAGLQAGQTYTVSVWLRGDNGGEVVVIGLNDCAATSFTVTNSWQRYTATYPNISSAVASCEGGRGFEMLGGGPTYYAWGAQTEQAAAAGPYVATGSSTETLHYYIADHLGSTSVVTDAVGAVQNDSDYSPYGQEIPVTAHDPNHYKFTGKERDTESGLDYFGARYYGLNVGRFMSPDPTFLNIRRVFNPQRWNMYSYALDNPLTNIDPDGNETIAVVYPNYQAAYQGDHTIGLGHGAVIIADKDGTTHYFEYGRYRGPDGKTDSKGLMREEPTPPVQRDSSGNITPDSMNNLLKTVSSQSGKGGTTDALIVPTTSAEDASILAYLKAREAENRDPNRQKYSLFGGHNCGTLACESLRGGGVNVPAPLQGLWGGPYANWFRIWAQFQNAAAYQYQPKEHVTVRIYFNDQIVH